MKTNGCGRMTCGNIKIKMLIKVACIFLADVTNKDVVCDATIGLNATINSKNWPNNYPRSYTETYLITQGA